MKVLILLIAVCILLWPSTANAEPLISNVEIGECVEVPFSGVLMNDEAVLALDMGKEFAVEQLELKHEYELKMLQTKYEYDLQIANIEQDSLQRQFDQTTVFLNGEIDRLSIEDPDYSMWIFLGGTAIGILLTIGVLYTVAPAF